MRNKAALYVHGRGGSAAEAASFAEFCPGYDVIGVEYAAEQPRQTPEVIRAAFLRMQRDYGGAVLIANSIGAYFSMLALGECEVEKALFISPVLDMEALITDMMGWAGVNEAQLQAAAELPTTFGETLSWEELQYVRAHPIHWDAPTCILYAEGDTLISRKMVDAFISSHPATLTVMPGGEHWFHTPEEMSFLDDWMRPILADETAPA